MMGDLLDNNNNNNNNNNDNNVCAEVLLLSFNPQNVPQSAFSKSMHIPR